MKCKHLYLLLFTVVPMLLIGQIDLKQIGSYKAGSFDEGGSEIIRYDERNQQIYSSNGEKNAVDVIDISDPANPILKRSIDITPYGEGITSVETSRGLILAAVEGADQENGKLVLFSGATGEFIKSFETGVLPDAIRVSPNGDYVVVANEGEPNDDYTVDPEGSITVINLSGGWVSFFVDYFFSVGQYDFVLNSAQVTQLDFTSYNDQKDALIAEGVRLFGPNATVAQDLEPENVVFSPSGRTAYISAQENNAMIVVDVSRTPRIKDIMALGTKDHSQLGNGFDASDRSSGINIQSWPVRGFYMPDAMGSLRMNGVDYIVTANEGDARDYDGYSEEARVKDLVLDPTVYPNADFLQQDEILGRLKTTTAHGDTDGDGDVDQIYSYGARSFSIWTMDGQLLFDSGDEFERILQRVDRANFNSTNDDNDSQKNRSDDKGPEPEAIRTLIYEGRFYAMIGLERQGGIMIYDITDPMNAKFVNYVSNRNFSADAESDNAGDLGIEDIIWIRPSQSPNGKSLIATANEVSSTVTIYEIVAGEFTPPTANIFEEEINITDYAPTEVVMPPSPLTTEVVFVGGHDIVQTTATYGNPAGRAIAKEWHDFIGFTPDDSGASLGWVSVNHERIYRDDRIGDGGGMTTFRIAKDGSGSIEVMNQTLEDGRSGEFFNVDFVNTVGETGMNCAGISAPNGRIWTAEEWYRTSQSSINRSDTGVRDTSDFTIDAPEFPEVDGMTIKKYENFNYMVEIDPKQAMAIRKQYNWGRGGWEGGAITADGNTVYLGMDATPAPWVKYEADTPWDFNNGTLYVYKEDADEKWLPVPATADNMLGGLSDYAWSVGATMFNRNEWVTIDQRTGIVYWTETGRDNPGGRWADEAAEGGTYARHHQLRAINQGVASPGDSGYWDYFGRVLYYDPATNYVGVTIEGGPYLESSPSIADYPSKHLSNPDGLNVLHVGDKSYLMIQEDLNGTSFGRTPEGVSNRLCELYLLDTETRDAVIDDLVRITAVPAGAEITGAIQIDDNTILVNSQHPRTDNPFPFNHSLTMAIHGFESLNASDLQGTTMSANFKMNTISREIELGQSQDFAIYDNEGKRMKVFRNKAIADVGDFDEGTYYLKTESDLYKITID